MTALPEALYGRFSRDRTQDALGSVRMITDASGAVVARLEYGAWGEEIFVSAIPALANFPYRFVGGAGVRTDSETGLVYMRQRWFSPELARFMSRDPIGLEGGANLYSYVGNNPVVFTDPLGLERTWNPLGTGPRPDRGDYNNYYARPGSHLGENEYTNNYWPPTPPPPPGHVVRNVRPPWSPEPHTINLPIVPIGHGNWPSPAPPPRPTPKPPPTPDPSIWYPAEPEDCSSNEFWDCVKQFSGWAILIGLRLGPQAAGAAELLILLLCAIQTSSNSGPTPTSTPRLPPIQPGRV